MKKLIFTIVACFCFISAYAAYLTNVPKTLTQPDGSVLHCFASGDEFFNYLHDENGFTIMQHPQTGFYVYADKRDGQLVATEFVAGRVDPASKNLQPFNLISPQEWMARRNAWQENDPQPFNRSGNPNHGTLNNISIFIRFSDDEEFTNTYSSIDNMFNNESENAISLKTYFRAASYNAIEIPTYFYPGHNGETIISYQDTYPRSYFQPYNATTNPNGYQDDERADREFSLLQRAVTYINANYPVPTSLNIDYDNDGRVDNVCFIVRGTTGDWSSLLWPHKWSLYDRNVYINGKRVYTFNFQLADATGYFNTSTMCHEMNHSLGAPDLYHYSYTGPSPVGIWDLMQSNTTPPQHCGAYMKMKYGHWVDAIPEITQAGTYTLNPISSTTPTNIAYKIQSDDPNQFYVLEYRDNTSLFETGLPGSGLLIYRIDTRFNGNADYNPDNGIYDEVYIFRPGGSTSENGNLNSAYFSSNVGRTEFSSSTSAYPFFTDGTIDNNFRIYNITSAGSTISFSYGTSSDCGAPTNFVATVEDNNVTLSWNAATNAVSYNIYRDGSLIDNISGTTYVDSNLNIGRYTYFLRSVDANGLFSAASESVTVSLLPEGSVIIGEGGTATNELLPSYSYYKYALSQQIYTAEELGEAGVITSIAFYNGGAEKTRTYDFYLKSTTKSSFSSTTDWETVSNTDKVFSGSVTMVANGWTMIALDTPFNYDGTSNLILVADDNSGAYTSSPHMSCRVFNAPSQTLRIYSDGVNYNPFAPTSYTGTIMDVKNQLLLTIEEPPTSFNITVSANPAEGGTVSGAGSYNEGTNATLTATAATGYTFVNWTKDGTEVSTQTTYSFTVTEDAAYVANFSLNSYVVTAMPNSIEGGTVTVGGGCYINEFFYDFEDGTSQGWTILQGPGSDSPNNWMHCTEYMPNDFSSGHGHNSNGFMLSESYVFYDSNSGIDVHPDNYLVSPQVQLGGSITFWVTNAEDNLGAEHFAIAVSMNGNTDASDFTTVQEWTFLAEKTGGSRNINDGTWYEYTVDLSAFSGMGYVAIHHFNCTDQWLLCVDDITIVEGYTGICTGTYNHGESCTVTATANDGYTFINWTNDGTEVSTETIYSFTVTEVTTLVANFTLNNYLVTAMPIPVEGGTVTVEGSCTMDEFFYDFEDGTSQGWTTLQGPNGDSPNNWMYCADYTAEDFSSGHGHNASNGFMLSESYVFYDANSGIDVYPDNYLVSPQVQLGGSITFWATNVDDGYGAEHFAVAVSTNGNTDASDFTTVQEWTLLAGRTGGTRNINDGTWYEYTADLSAFNGLGYVAIHHFNCTDQWLLCVDDITIVEGYTGICSGTYNHGDSCTLTATANEGYTFTNWTKDGTEVSTQTTYSFTVTEDAAYVANFSLNSYVVTAMPSPIEGGTVTVGDGCYINEFFYNFEDGTSQGWTILQGPGSDSPNNWMHCVEYMPNDFSSGHGHNSNGFMLSESYVFYDSNSGIDVHPDNYLISPQVQLGGSITFWVTNAEDNLGAEHFAIAVSMNGNTDASDFTTVQEWTLLAEKTGGSRNIDDGTWYEYTVDLSAFSGMGYVAIRHFNCTDQWLLCVDDITIVEGYNGICTGTYNHGESCTVTATANEGYTFINWTEGEEVVSTDAAYNFEVTADRYLVANFEINLEEQTYELLAGWNWWSTNLDITLDQLKDALVAALPGATSITIKSQENSISYNGTIWRGRLTEITVGQMYEIQTPESCTITLNGIPVSQVELTIKSGNNWIALPLTESMTLTDVFGTFPVNGDIIKSKEGRAAYNGTMWRGTLENLEPGQGYIYNSAAEENRTFIWGINK